MGRHQRCSAHQCNDLRWRLDTGSHDTNKDQIVSAPLTTLKSTKHEEAQLLQVQRSDIYANFSPSLAAKLKASETLSTSGTDVDDKCSFSYVPHSVMLLSKPSDSRRKTQGYLDENSSTIGRLLNDMKKAHTATLDNLSSHILKKAVMSSSEWSTIHPSQTEK